MGQVGTVCNGRCRLFCVCAQNDEKLIRTCLGEKLYQPGVQRYFEQTELSSPDVDGRIVLDWGFRKGQLFFALIALGSTQTMAIGACVGLPCIDVELQCGKHGLAEFRTLVLHQNNEVFGRFDANYVTGWHAMLVEDRLERRCSFAIHTLHLLYVKASFGGDGLI